MTDWTEENGILRIHDFDRGRTLSCAWVYTTTNQRGIHISLEEKLDSFESNNGPIRQEIYLFGRNLEVFREFLNNHKGDNND